MTEKSQKAREIRIKRLRAKYGDTLKNVSENCRNQAIIWNTQKIPRSA